MGSIPLCTLRVKKLFFHPIYFWFKSGNQKQTTFSIALRLPCAFHIVSGREIERRGRRLSISKLLKYKTAATD